jgi:hypothetical protein
MKNRINSYQITNSWEWCSQTRRCDGANSILRRELMWICWKITTRVLEPGDMLWIWKWNPCLCKASMDPKQRTPVVHDVKCWVKRSRCDWNKESVLLKIEEWLVEVAGMGYWRLRKKQTGIKLSLVKTVQLLHVCWELVFRSGSSVEFQLWYYKTESKERKRERQELFLGVVISWSRSKRVCWW